MNVQRRVLWALMMREVITRFGRHNIGVLWLMAEPMLFTLGVGAFWFAADLHHGSGIQIFAFAITGYSTVLMWRNTVTHCSHAVHSNLPLLFHRNVRVLDVLLARIVLEIAGATASFAVLTAVFLAGGWIRPPQDLGMVIAGWLMLSWFGTALALTIGAATAFSQIISRLWNPASYLLFPLSGAAFMADWWAPVLRDTLLLLPMVHCVELIREGYMGGPFRYHHDMGYVAAFNLVLTLIGLWFVREAGWRAEAE
jgi:ABC-type polysaccharide/polyol phosphate export permease